MSALQTRENRDLQFQNERLRDKVNAAQAEVAEQRADLDFERAYQRQHRPAAVVQQSTPGRDGKAEFNELVHHLMVTEGLSAWAARRRAYEMNPGSYGRWVSGCRVSSREALLADVR